MKTWSFSKYNAFKTCLRWGFKRYIENEPPQGFEPREFEKGTEFQDHVQGYLSRTTDFLDINVYDNVSEAIERIRNEYTDLISEYKVEQEFYDIAIVGKLDLYSETQNTVIEIKSYPVLPKEQLEFYAALLYPTTKQDLRVIVITPTKVLSEYWGTELQEEALRKTMKRIADIEKQIEELGSIPRIGAHCYYCQYKNSCEGLSVRKDIKYILEKQDGELLARIIFKLENRVSEYKEIAKEFAKSDIPVQFGNYRYDFIYYEEVEDYDPAIVNFLTEKGINPFEILLPRWKKPKKLFSINKQVLNDLAKTFEEIAQFVSFKIGSTFRGSKTQQKEE